MTKRFIALLCMFFILTSCADSPTEENSVPPTETPAILPESAGENKADDEENELSTIYIIQGKVEVSIPKSFDVMSEELLKMKYPSDNRPTTAYTNEDGTVNVAFNYTQERTTSEDMSALVKVFEDSFESHYPSAHWYRSGLEVINGRDVGVLELITPAADTEIYNLLWFTDLDGRLMVMSFNCTVEELDNWRETANSIMGSFKLT